ncbi:TPA: alveolar soft part sarcoma chromosome region, candidate 1-like [Bos taurus]|nr:TPA: alveolar soft part sarcoma chromosome region, candidate 1-like [Bos taurus]
MGVEGTKNASTGTGYRWPRGQCPGLAQDQRCPNPRAASRLAGPYPEPAPPRPDGSPFPCPEQRRTTGTPVGSPHPEPARSPAITAARAGGPAAPAPWRRSPSASPLYARLGCLPSGAGAEPPGTFIQRGPRDQSDGGHRAPRRGAGSRGAGASRRSGQVWREAPAPSATCRRDWAPQHGATGESPCPAPGWTDSGRPSEAVGAERAPPLSEEILGKLHDLSVCLCFLFFKAGQRPYLHQRAVVGLREPMRESPAPEAARLCVRLLRIKLFDARRAGGGSRERKMAAPAGGGGSAVSVLAPNGRRHTVKVTPSTVLLQVLEDTCRRQDFNPNEYDLKFQRNVLDLSVQWRFANLPNNAKLEMVPISRSREGPENMVRIALQLDDGSRLQDTFCSGQSLWELLCHFAQIR